LAIIATIVNEERPHETKADVQEPSKVKKRSDLFGKNFLGVTYIAPDFEEDLPWGMWLDEEFPLK